MSWRGARTCYAVLNTHPYIGGHLMVVPYKQVADLSGMTDGELADLLKLVRRCQAALTQVMKPDGFNIGMNLGRAARAGIEHHLHIHVVLHALDGGHQLHARAHAHECAAGSVGGFGGQTSRRPRLMSLASETLHFENARMAQQLFNNDLRNLQNFWRRSWGVKATSRDGWDQAGRRGRCAIERAKQFFLLLEDSLKSGSTVRNREFAHALSVVSNEGAAALKDLLSERIQTSTRKSSVTPRTAGQKKYIDAIRAHDVTFGIGPAGTGKTYLAMAMAVSALKEEKVARIILTRPAVEAGEALGFLPGDLYEKITPYLRPLYDALQDMLPADEIQKCMERNVIEIAPLAYMRGRTLNHAFIILDEAQNATAEQMFMFLTRLGQGSKAVITGDETQVDLPPHKHSGLLEAHRALRNTEGIALVEFTRRDVVRHPLGPAHHRSL